jgi:hypothetical protein
MESGLLNDYDFSTEDDHGTRAICGHRRSPVPGRIVFALTSETSGQYSKRDCNRADDLGAFPRQSERYFRMSAATEFDNGAQAYTPARQYRIVAQNVHDIGSIPIRRRRAEK